MKVLSAAIITLAILLMFPTLQALSAGAGFDSLVDATTTTVSSVVPAGNAPATRSEGAPTITLRTGSGATIAFKSENGATVYGLPPAESELPHLVLFRNGELTDPQERTLIVEIGGIAVPPTGLTVSLKLETEHGDPDRGGGSSTRIIILNESQQVAPTAAGRGSNETVVFQHEFREKVLSGGALLSTPTDYLRYEVTLSGDNIPHSSVSQDHAILMESQWVVDLPQVAEESPGAAPDELVVYTCDMFPLRKRIGDTATWLPREALSDYLGSDLIPAMVAAFRVQTDVWSFPWNAAWTSYRAGADAERLSVAITDGETWFHGRAPDSGLSGISMASRDTAHYESLTDALMSVFHHELFHSLQRNINLSLGGDGNVDGAEDAWEFITEGTAVLASSVAQREVQFGKSSIPRIYLSYAALFPQNGSYQEMDPYRGAFYWRFLYESCGGMNQGVEEPATGMQVIREVLVALYSGEVVDIRTSTDLVEELPAVMDLALSRSPNCPFRSFRESLNGFARAVYALRLSGGRCTAPGLPAGCGLYDPNALYREPLASGISYQGEELVYAHSDQPFPAGIAGSYGFDFLEVDLELGSGALVVELTADRSEGTEFSVQMVRLVESEGGPVAVSAPVVLAQNAATYRLTTVVPATVTGEFNRLGLIITRLDSGESVDPVGAYTLVVRPAEPNDLP